MPPWLLSFAVTLLLDQWSKRMVRVHLGDRCVSWGPLLRIRRVTHRKASYARAGRRALLILIWLLAFVSAVLLHRSGGFFQGSIVLVALGAAFGGAAGNLIDILRARHVEDFVDLRKCGVFNVADVGIVAGLLVAFFPAG